jgi:hypothetical protein
VRKQIIQGLKDNHDGRNSFSYKVCLVARRPERGGELRLDGKFTTFAAHFTKAGIQRKVNEAQQSGPW